MGGPQVWPSHHLSGDCLDSPLVLLCHLCLCRHTPHHLIQCVLVCPLWE